MDQPTLQFYAAHAPETAGRYAGVKSAAADLFQVAFITGSRVLDVGCGSGRDLRALVDAGFDGHGVDASEEMLREARCLHATLADRIRRDSLPALSSMGDASVDGILCWAVLMHVPEEQLFDTVFNLRRVLKAGGRLLISTPREGPAVDPATRRDQDGRLFNGVTPENFHFLLEKVGFRRLSRWDSPDSLGRAGRSWATQLFVLGDLGSRSLDRIESILNRDKKDATYKPALFRALAELATTAYHAAVWLPEGKVAIPLSLIADKWLEYFWPLFESETFIPQKRGERRVCPKPVAFRAELDALIALYRSRGGLCAFSVDHRSDQLPIPARVLHRKVRSKLCDTIRSGPIYFAGGGGSRTFVYDPLSRRVLMDADLWRELSVMGSWIADATVLRWAELTAEISQGALRPSQVIDQLLTTPIPEREVGIARSLYAGLETKVCVWTDRSLRSEFDVDHAIPFALWRNNDLWNLLPAAPTANNEKRDRLPTQPLLRSRKDCIVHYWSLMRAQHPIRFDFEAGKLVTAGVVGGSNWENPLFAAMVEAVEFTAIQRGIDRWEPSKFYRAAPRPASPPSPPRDVPPTRDANSIILLDPPESDRFVLCVPFYDVAAAAGGFGPEQPGVDPHNHHTWVRVEAGRLTPDMFAIRVVGRSMEPKIPDGACCLFRGGDALVGTRQGRIVLVALRDCLDPETGGRLTVKRYLSQKILDDAGEFRHTRIELHPLNPAFRSIVIERADEGMLQVVGEFVKVLSASPQDVASTCR